MKKVTEQKENLDKVAGGIVSSLAGPLARTAHAKSNTTYCSEKLKSSDSQSKIIINTEDCEPKDEAICTPELRL